MNAVAVTRCNFGIAGPERRGFPYPTVLHIEKTGDVLRDAKSTHFFGAEPSQVGGLLAPTRM